MIALLPTLAGPLGRAPWRFSIGLLSFVAMGTMIAAEETSLVSFERDIRPILSENCFHCHGPDEAERKAGLRLDLGPAAKDVLKSGDRAIVPGRPDESALVSRVQSADPDELMPPSKSGKVLSHEERELLTRWVAEGAEFSVHWAFRPLERAPFPEVAVDSWGQNGIDTFVLAKLDSERITPSPEANRYQLIKRLYYDLLGLLPPVDDVRDFVADRDPLAYERLVDRLLESEHFGERWGRHWLDRARYADSDGYEKDNARPSAWKYRDWVIKAINEDMPFDRFTIEQLAGDLLPEATLAQRLATAFHRQTLTNTEGGTDQEQWRVAAVMDRTETTGTVWMGLTVGCARCHTHKFDPISHREYYRLYAFFNNGDESHAKILKSPYAGEQFDRLKPDYDAAWESVSERIKARVMALESGFGQWLQARQEESAAKATKDWPEDFLAVIKKPELEWSDDERALALKRYHLADPQLVALREEQAEVKKREPASPYLNVRVLTQRSENPRQTYVLERGEFTKPQEAVAEGVLSVLPPIRPRVGREVLDRLDFARWLVSGKNPLPPRVVVNDIWAQLFGVGLVATRNDFGVRGELPSHPQLLDFLASEFVNGGWSRKKLIKTVVMSATYRQSSHHRPELAGRDPKNRWLARQNRFRVEAEIVRDLYLDAANLLSHQVGGESVFPPTSKDVVALTYNSSVRWKVSAGGDKYRRGLYTFFKRTAPHPNLMLFDCPDSNTTCIERNRSNTPLAALTTLNNEVFVEAARAFADRALRLNTESDRERLVEAFLIATVRHADEAELDALVGLLDEARQYYQTNAEAARELMQENLSGDIADSAAWTVVGRAILNLDEVITRE